MSIISADQVKELRDRTGAGMMDCKAALKECGNDIEKAIDYLRKKGMASAAKRAGRDAKEGVILSKLSANKAVILEANCETDFVARTDDFKTLAEMALNLAFEQGEQAINAEPVASRLAELSGKIGEKMLVRRAAVLSSNDGVFYSYIHATGKLGVIVELSSSKKDAALDELGKNIAMQVAASNPMSLDRQGISADAIAREKDIYKEEIKGKPENVVDRIMQGKLEKFYQTNVLLEQPFIKDDKISVSKLIEETSKKIGSPVSVRRYVRYQLGEGTQS